MVNKNKLSFEIGGLFFVVVVLMVGNFSFVDAQEHINFNEISELNNELFKISSESISIYDRALGIFGVGKSAQISNELETKTI